MYIIFKACSKFKYNIKYSIFSYKKIFTPDSDANYKKDKIKAIKKLNGPSL